MQEFNERTPASRDNYSTTGPIDANNSERDLVDSLPRQLCLALRLDPKGDDIVPRLGEEMDKCNEDVARNWVKKNLGRMRAQLGSCGPAALYPSFREYIETAWAD